MCGPILLAAATVAGAAASTYSQYQAAKAQTRAINQAQDAASTQAAAQAGAELTARARAARVERAAARAAASDSGVNLGGGSFLAALQTSAMDQSYDEGVILYNNKNQVAAINTDAASALTRVTRPTLLGAGLTIGQAGYNGYKAGQRAAKTGADSATG